MATEIHRFDQGLDKIVEHLGQRIFKPRLLDLHGPSEAAILAFQMSLFDKADSRYGLKGRFYSRNTPSEEVSTGWDFVVMHGPETDTNAAGLESHFDQKAYKVYLTPYQLSEINVPQQDPEFNLAVYGVPIRS
jgi:hypothetical protein